MSNSSTNLYPTAGLSSNLIALRTCFSAFLALLITAGNILSIAVTRRVSNLADSTKVLMTTLAVYDLLVGVLMLLNIAPSALDRWPFGSWGCRMFTGAETVAFWMSLTSLLFLNVERYIAVNWPYKFPVWCSRRRVIAPVIVASTLCVIAAVIVQLWGVMTEYNPNSAMCFYRMDSTVINMLALIFLFVLPVSVLTFIYYRLIKISRRHKQRNDRNGANRANRIQYNKALKTFLVVTLIFGGCSLPYFLYQIWQGFVDFRRLGWLETLLIWLYISNSACNVFVYCLFNPVYRQVAKDIIAERLPCRKRQVSAGDI